MQKNLFSALAIVALALLCFSSFEVTSNSQNNTYYIDRNHPQASDDNPGTEAAPWLTIQHAADTAQAGDTVIVKAGTFRERVVPQNSGMVGFPITFKAQPRRSVTMWGFYTVNSNYLRIEGFNITTDDSLTGWTETIGVFIRSDNVEVVDNYFYDIDATAIGGYWHEPFPQEAHVAHNTIYHCQMGIGIQGRGWIVENNEIERLFQYGAGDCDYSRFFGDDHVVRGNYFHGTNFDEIGSAHVDCFQTFTNNGEHAYNILFEGNVCMDFHQALMASNIENTPTSHFTFRNNLFARGHAWGLCVHDVSYITAENNTFANIAYHGAGFRGNSIGNVIRNNIFYDVSSSYWASDGGQVSGDYNLIFEAGEPSVAGPHNLIDVDPLFVNPANYDFHLQADSPAIDTGLALEQVSVDLDQVSRPQGAGWDIGAFEYFLPLKLQASSRDRALRLSWQVSGTLPVSTTWRIGYDGPPGDESSPITGIISATRAYTLSGLTNDVWYTLTLSGMVNHTPHFSDTVVAMPMGAELALRARPGDGQAHLSWDILHTLQPFTGTWHIGYESDSGTLEFPAAEIPTATVRSHTLTGLSNGVWYTVTLNALTGSATILSDTARVMPTSHLLYLPLVMRAH